MEIGDRAEDRRGRSGGGDGLGGGARDGGGGGAEEVGPEAEGESGGHRIRRRRILSRENDGKWRRENSRGAARNVGFFGSTEAREAAGE